MIKLFFYVSILFIFAWSVYLQIKSKPEDRHILFTMLIFILFLVLFFATYFILK
jgi:hypothetical protein